MFCPKCGYEYQNGYYKCSDCEVDLVEEECIIKIDSIYASLYKRLGAFLIDFIILALMEFALLYTFAHYLASRTQPMLPIIEIAIGIGFGIAPFWLYNSLFECSIKKATIGKMVFGIIVVDENGNALSFKKASLRAFIKLLTYCLSGFVFLIALSSEKKQTVHDTIAKTLVLNAKHDKQLQ